MDLSPERLRSLADNKYFAIVAVVFFAFLTALIFSIFAYENQSPSDEIREQFTATDSRGGDLSAKNTDIGQIHTDESQQENDMFTPSRIADTISSARGIPDIKIDNFTLTGAVPQSPKFLKIYKLKSSFTKNEVVGFARQLGFTVISEAEHGVSLSQIYDYDQKHYLGFDRSGGKFTYLSETGFTPKNQERNIMDTAKNVLEEVGIDHPSIKSYATYKRADDKEDYIYVELHSDWDLFGGPILNPLAILTLNESDDLALFSIDKNPGKLMPNANIISTSDNRDGLARAEDINTIVVKMKESDGRVYGLSSNIPKIEESQSLVDGKIISPTEAFDLYTQGHTNFEITGPSGFGYMDLEEVYKNNIAYSDSVTVTDFEIAYVSLLGTPDWWCPTYIFRSYGQVETGFEVQYVHTAPATSDQRCQAAILGAQDTRLAQAGITHPPTPASTVPISPGVPTIVNQSKGQGLQYGTWKTLPNIKEQITTPPRSGNCVTNFVNYRPDSAHSMIVDLNTYWVWLDPPNLNCANTTVKANNRKYTFNNVEKDIEEWAGTTHSADCDRVWMVVTIGTGEFTDIPVMLSQAALETRRYVYNNCTVGASGICPYDSGIANLNIISCTSLTIGSPWIYAYLPENSDSEIDVRVELDPVGGIAYAQPQLTSWQGQYWAASLSKDGLFFPDGTTKKALHWEYKADEVRQAYAVYDKKPTDAFIIESSQVSLFIKELSRKMGLTKLETDNLLSEFNRKSLDIDTRYIKIAFVPQGFLDESLPLNITPKPDTINRIMLEITPINQYIKAARPEIPMVSRNGFTIVEIGVLRTH